MRCPACEFEASEDAVSHHFFFKHFAMDFEASGVCFCRRFAFNRRGKREWIRHCNVYGGLENHYREVLMGVDEFDPKKEVQPRSLWK